MYDIMLFKLAAIEDEPLSLSNRSN